MKILLIGADGFVGRYVASALRGGTHEVMESSRSGKLPVDLNSKDSVTALLNKTQPQIIINTAGVLSNSGDVNLNIVFTSNLLEAVKAECPQVKRVIITGSAAEYGHLTEADLPVSESTPRHATAGYGLSKMQEVDTALKLGQKFNLPVVIARLFNPIGTGMHPSLLAPNLIRQVSEIKTGRRKFVELSRLDSKRDYVAMRDVAQAFKLLVESDPQHNAYNIGSGQATTNGELLKYIVEASGLEHMPTVRQSLSEPEPVVASQADISRIHSEFGWQPQISIQTSVKEIVDAATRNS